MIQSAEEYWTNKHPKIVQFYKGRYLAGEKHGLVVDIRHFLTQRDGILDSVLANEIFANTGPLSRMGFDNRMDEIRSWVIRGRWKKDYEFASGKGRRVLEYVGDDKTRGVPDFWQYHYETLRTGVGDCEDGAILIGCLALCAGIPVWRVRFTAGWVKPSPTAPQGGHGYIAYCREPDNEYIPRDWCYYADPTLTSAADVPIKQRPEYGEAWFSTTADQTYGNREYEIRGRVSDTPQND